MFFTPFLLNKNISMCSSLDYLIKREIYILIEQVPSYTQIYPKLSIGSYWNPKLHQAKLFITKFKPESNIPDANRRVWRSIHEQPLVAKHRIEFEWPFRMATHLYVFKLLSLIVALSDPLVIIEISETIARLKTYRVCPVRFRTNL